MTLVINYIVMFGHWLFAYQLFSNLIFYFFMVIELLHVNVKLFNIIPLV